MQAQSDPASELQRTLEQWLSTLLDGSNNPLWFWLVVLVLAGCVFTLWRMVRLAGDQRRRIRQLESKLHGSTVRRGYATEAIAPLLDAFPVDVGKAGTSTLFVGQPVDYIHFDTEQGVTFIEVKSGGAQLSARQRRLRELVERGAVEWKTMHVTSSSNDRSSSNVQASSNRHASSADHTDE